MFSEVVRLADDAQSLTDNRQTAPEFSQIEETKTRLLLSRAGDAEGAESLHNSNDPCRCVWNHEYEGPELNMLT
jgi:hypothetical protein